MNVVFKRLSCFLVVGFLLLLFSEPMFQSHDPEFPNISFLILPRVTLDILFLVVIIFTESTYTRENKSLFFL